MNAKTLLVVVGLVIGALAGWFTAPQPSTVDLGPLHMKVEGGDNGNGGNATVTTGNGGINVNVSSNSPLDNQEELASIDLAALARDAVGRRVHDGLRAGIDLGYQGPATPLFVAGNAAGLRDLLDNLIDNAVTYAGRRSTVTVSVTAEGDGSATLGVEDDGPGVPEAYLSRLGERFFRLPGSPDGGTGLGLAIVQRIADRHHAWVEYSRGTQGGLCVSIHFPATPQHA